VYLPLAFGAGGGHTRWVERGWGVNSSEDARHCSVLYVCKHFVPTSKDFFVSVMPFRCYLVSRIVSIVA
jgi:hypothetical protein